MLSLNLESKEIGCERRVEEVRSPGLQPGSLLGGWLEKNSDLTPMSQRGLILPRPGLEHPYGCLSEALSWYPLYQ